MDTANTTLTLTTSVNPSVFGQLVTFTAAVTGGSGPTGTVSFFDGATLLVMTQLDGSGHATLATSSLSVGSHSMTAVYNGDGNNPGSTSPVLTQVVNQASTTQEVTIYDDALQNGFQDWSYGGQASDINFASTAQVHGSTKSIAFVGDNFNAVSFAHPTQDFSAAQYPALHFWVHGGAAGGQQLRLYLQFNDAIVAQAELDTYIAGGAIVAGAWREVTVILGQAPLAYAGFFDRIDLQSDVGGGQPVLYIDDVGLVLNDRKLFIPIVLKSFISASIPRYFRVTHH